ncbi:MAG: aldo/keto reductase [Anaerolineae bacterium]|jgi:predicted oxidoreductase
MSVSQIDLAVGGPRFSRLALGFWRLAGWDLSDADLLDLIRASLDLGITTFDHADIYGDHTCQELFGRALALEPSLRERMQLVTKCGIMLASPNRPQHTLKHYDTSRANIVASVEESLRLLGTDYVNLLLIHRPDLLMDPDEVAEAFTALRQSGKVLHFGVSNFTPSQFDLLASRLDFPLVTNQIEVSVLHLDLLHDGTVDQCLQRGIAPMVWSPLAGGRIFTEDSEQAARVRQALQAVGQELGEASLDQVALAWVLAHPARFVPILGSSKIERIRSATGAEVLRLSPEQWFAIWCASTGTPVP